MTDWSPLLFAGGLAGLLAATWSRVKNVAWRLASLLVCRIEVHESLGLTLVEYLCRAGTPSRLRDRRYGQYAESDDGVYHLTPLEELHGAAHLFWLGRRPVWLSPPAAAGPSAPQALASGDRPPGDPHAARATVTFLRGTFDPDDLLRAAVGLRNDLARQWQARGVNRFRVVHVYDEGDDRKAAKFGGVDGPVGAGVNVDSPAVRFLSPLKRADGEPFVGLVYPPEVVAIVEDAKRWRKSRAWFAAKHMPWKTGWLLHGVPGTGKTSLARAIAWELRVPLVTVQLAGMADAEFRRRWAGDIRDHLPCVVLFEDFDNVFHGRENVSGPPVLVGSHVEIDNRHAGSRRPILGFDTLLNALDGVDRCEGLFTIITANDVTKLDPAIAGDGRATRPGRIDRVVELKPLTPEGLRLVVDQLLGEYPDDAAAAYAELAAKPTTPAQAREVCGTRALKRYWEKRED